MDNNNLSVINDDEIDLMELFESLWLAKLKIFVITGFFAICSLLYALSLPDYYKATALLAPAQSTGDGLSTTLGQLSGLASLAGVNIMGGGKSSESQIAQEIMKSWDFIEQFISDNELEVDIFATEGWSESSNELQVNQNLYDIKKGRWLIKNPKGINGHPTSWQLFERFSERLSVSEDVKSGLVKVSIEYYSPFIAKQWLDMYIDSINKYMQARQVAKVANNIDYVEAQIEKTSIAEMREVFYTIIEEQTKNMMVAEASPNYAFVTVSPSMVPEIKSKPKRSLIVILGTLFGLMLSILYVLGIQYINNRKS